MERLSDAIQTLAEQFLTGLAARLARIERALAELSYRPETTEALLALSREFHDLAGTGGSYGFDTLTSLSRAGEVRARRLAETSAPASADDVVHWRHLLALLLVEREHLLAGSPVVSSPALGPASSGPRTVLIVDAERETSLELGENLLTHGLSPVRASSLQQALALVSKELPVGLITDVRLPDGSGYELVRHVRALPGGRQVGILVASPNSDFLDKVEAIHSGADGYAVTPFEWDAMAERLLQYIERHGRQTARILSVEDDPDQALIIQTYLHAAGYQVEICAEPEDFETVVSAYQPDLVLLDISLPRLDGYTLARYLRQDERHATLPIIFLTGHAQPSVKVETLQAGGNDFLVKPVVPALLVATVAAHLERSRLLRGLLDRDGLTRLLTHTAFLERAKAAVSRQRRLENPKAALAMIDVDHFKLINDRYGHPTGDRVLIALSSLLRHRLRRSDVVGRYGGEEFAILIEDLELAEAERLVDRLRQDFAALTHTTSDGDAFHATFSGGVAMLDPTIDVERWKERADRALYDAKRQGRNRILPFRD
jgi:diguanylate cyclase (GGDEF)-like protein